MEQDYYLPHQTEGKAEEQTEQTESPKPKKQLDPHIVILAVQGVICAVILIFCLIVKLFFGNFFSEMKTWYHKNMGVDTDVKQVLEGTGGPLETGSVDLSGGFVMPVSGTLTSSYGYRADPFTGETAIHHGLDIAATEGTPVLASLTGQVVTAEAGHTDYGNYIILDHGGFQTLYAHCKTLTVTKGQLVAAGESIATCGSTGRSTGPHLHFEIRLGEKRIDPTPFFLAAADE